ncbi:hypothetical protein [Paenibacillus sp. MBLB4367]|uniref:hypothetical protein n=1 Tax=Paenibacillus sp. MBLB4367 TaxID=3384767 RepID=UPI0039082942
MKRLFGKLRSANGSVSVYLIIVIVPIFLFHALLIDVVRIRQAERETESAVRKGVRSALSAFDSSLQTYGLFGLDSESVDAPGLFSQVVDRNVKGGSANGGSFRELDLRLQPGGWKVTALQTLANHVVFRQQVQEEMKYRAPIEFALELTDKFRKSGIASNLTSTAAFGDNAEKLEGMLEKRDRALDEAWTKALEETEQARIFHSKYAAKLSELHEWGQKIGLNDAAELKRALSDASDRVRTMQESAESIRQSLSSTRGRISELVKKTELYADELSSLYEEERALEDDLQSASAGIESLLATKFELERLLEDSIRYAAAVQALKSEIGPDAERFNRQYGEVAQLIGEAQRLNDEVASEKRRLQQEAGGMNGPGAAESVWEHVPVYDLTYFSIYKTDAAKLAAIVQGLRQKIEEAGWIAGETFSAMSGSVTELKVQADRFRAEQGAKENERKSRNGDLAEEKRKQHTIMQGALNNARNAMGSCGVLSADRSVEAYKKLEGDNGRNIDGLARKYAGFNQIAAAAKDTFYEPGDPGTAGKNAMTWIKRFTDVLTGFRSELYMTEFALTKFNYRTFGMEKAANGKPKPSSERSAPATHVLANQEAEYILYGFDSCAANVSAAYGEMYVMLLAVRTTEALADPKKQLLQAGSPLLVFLAGLAQGAIDAFADMSKLIDGDAVPILKKAAGVTVDYKELLRIFMLLHTNDTAMMTRMQGLIELNTGKDLTLHAASIQANAQTSMRLWFAPLLAKVANVSGGISCEPRGNRCEMFKSASMSY